MKTMPKILQFFILCYKCIFHAGEHGESIRTFLQSYRRGKSSKITLDFVKSIIIGIPIQMITCWRPSLRQHFGLPHRAAGKMTSCKKSLLPEGVLHTRVRRAHAPTSPRSSLPQRKRAPHNRSRRPSMNLDFLFPWQGFWDMPS